MCAPIVFCFWRSIRSFDRSFLGREKSILIRGFDRERNEIIIHVFSINIYIYKRMIDLVLVQFISSLFLVLDMLEQVIGSC